MRRTKPALWLRSGPLPGRMAWLGSAWFGSAWLCTACEDPGRAMAPERPAPDEVRTERSEVHTPQEGRHRRVILLGIDGMDPDLVDRWRGELPTLDAMIGQFDCPRLAPPGPPQRAAAWTSFATVRSPGHHGIVDVYHRDPERLVTVWGTATLVPPELSADGDLLQAGSARSRLQVESFWKYAADAGIAVKVLAVPYAFPPADLGDGLALSTAGTADLLGEVPPSFILDSAVDSAEPRIDRGGVERVRLRPIGPRQYEFGVYRLPASLTAARELLLRVHVDPDLQQADVVLGTRQVSLRPGELSEWLELELPVSDQYTARAHVRFFPLELGHERVRIYMTPLHPDPGSPHVLFSHPPSYSKALAERHGLFPNLGRVHDLRALELGLVTEGLVEEQLRAVFEKRLEILLAELDKGDADLFVSALTAPAMAARIARLDREAGVEALPDGDPRLLETYRWMDRAIREVRNSISPDDILVAFSPAGLAPFTRAVDLNAWLREQGYLDAPAPAELGPDGVRWESTRAYAVGNGQIFLNLVGREARGVVTADEAEATLAEITRGLEALRDPAAGDRPVVKAVLTRSDLGGEREIPADLLPAIPDLLVRFEPGYQVGIQARRGQMGDRVFSGDTACYSMDAAASDPAQVEGFVVATLPGFTRGARLVDIAPTVLARLGIDLPEQWTGKDLVEEMRHGGTLEPSTPQQD